MRLVDYLICVLQAHAQSLQRLAALFGEEVLVEMLESVDEEKLVRPDVDEASFDQPVSNTFGGGGSAYGELEGAVREIELPERLKFYVWAYPFYRAYIESSLELTARVRNGSSGAGPRLVDQAVDQAQTWVRTLPLPPTISAQAERAAQIPWLRFRTEVLKRVGSRPLGPVV